MPVAPVMIYGDDVTHVVTEEGIAYLYKTECLEERFDARDGLPSIVPETWPTAAAATARRRMGFALLTRQKLLIAQNSRQPR